MSIVARDMRAEDWPGVAEIYRQGLKTGVSTLEGEVPTFEEWDAAHDKRCRLVVVSRTVTDKVIAWAALTPVSRRRVYSGVAEVSIYVDEEYRGQKMGQFLLNTLIEESEKEGFWMLQSSILLDNLSSLILHHRCGFREVGLRVHIGRNPQGKWCSLVLLERRSRTVGVGDS
ncbi:MAG: GNAT family N-acetyltransferase [Synergistaceae bacterium]|jgi:phosphinothricin acetyltransferase|nr:GNAT family N-acetyltransferase [Synergistaceae bacterium]